MTNLAADNSPNFKARAAGFAWLVTFVTGAFAMYIGGRFVVNGNAAATAANILANESAFRIGVAGNLLATVCYLLATILVYQLFKPVNRTLSLTAAVFSLLGCGLGALVSLLNFAPLTLLKGSAYLSSFTTAQLQALALTAFNFANRANEVGLVFFGLHIGIVGYLIVTSALVPRIIGALLIMGGVCYDLNSFGSFLAAPFAKSLFPFILLPAFFAELALSLWFLIKGVNAPRLAERSVHGVPQGLTIAAVLCFGMVSPGFAQQNQDALKQRLLAQVQSVSPDEYAFTRTARTKAIAGGNTEETVNVEKFDPAKPANARWTLASVDGAAPSAEVLAKFKKEVVKRRVPGYHRLANYVGSPATVSTDSRGRTVFRFGTLPKGSVIVMDSDLSQNSTAEVVVGDANGTPFAEEVRITTKPSRMKLIMKLNSYESVAHYRLGPDGKPILAEATTDMSGSGLGMEGKMHSVATYSDYRAVGGHR